MVRIKVQVHARNLASAADTILKFQVETIFVTWKPSCMFSQAIYYYYIYVHIIYELKMLAFVHKVKLK